jgi:predicted short-subunit dehydrogenase-like oxidoreductase (DUF2520 family)
MALPFGRPSHRPPKNSRRYDLSHSKSRWLRGKPLVGIVGAGRVGCALGRLLHERGWRIGPVITRSIRTARAARRRIGSGQPHARLSDAVLSADLILIATPDRAIARTAEVLAELGTHGGRRHQSWAGKIVLHTSGALPSDVLKPLALRGAAIGSLHPLQTFGERAVPSLADATCAIEGSPAAVRMARRICRELGGIAVVVPPRRKSAYHAGAALAAGHVLAVVEAAVRMLTKAGFSRKNAIRALLPLTRQTLANFERVGPHASWTGPLSRGDFAVIRQHVHALRDLSREYREAYAALSRLAMNLLAKGSGQKKRQLEKALAGIR